MRHEQIIVFVGACCKHVRIQERYESTYMPLGPRGAQPLARASANRYLTEPAYLT